jgi:hypothetical protein
MGFFGFGSSEAPSEEEQIASSEEVQEGQNNATEAAWTAAGEHLKTIKKELGLENASNEEFLELMKNILDEMDNRPDDLSKLYDDRSQDDRSQKEAA